MKVKYTNLDKVYFPDEGYTKGDVIAYYERMAEVMLPYLMDRPMVLNRHPNGIAKPSFYQKDNPNELPDFIETESIFSESNNKDIQYIVCRNSETILYMANLGCIEMNPWNSRVQNLGKPDWYVIDLDPGNNTFEQVIEVAKVTKELLDLSCEKSYVKTSGKTGIHIYIPLGGKYGYEQIREFARLIAQTVHQRIPDITSIDRDPRKRRKKIYIDFLQNRIGQTLAAPYSLRPVKGANVSAPLEWKEVRKGLTPEKFNIKSIERRLKTKGDLWDGLLEDSVNLSEAIKCLEAELGK